MILARKRDSLPKSRSGSRTVPKALRQGGTEGLRVLAEEQDGATELLKSRSR
ncbi:hypothetical protein [Salinispira pacifica]